MNPDPGTARGFWGEPAVPVLAGAQIAANLRLLGRAPQKTPELLLRSPARIFAGATILAFSHADLASLQRLGSPPGGATLSLGHFPGYDPTLDPLGTHRQALDEYLIGHAERPSIDFDAIRHRVP